MDLNDNLNEKQLQAVTTTEGAVLVLAGPGSGKTRVLTHRIAYLINELNVAPYNILAITFTNKATKEMQERLAKLVPQQASGVWVSTFHAMCRKILSIHIDKLGYDKNFTIYDDKESERVLKRILVNKHMEPKNWLESIKWHIANAKNKALSPKQYDNCLNDKNAETIINIYAAYEQELADANALDFNDLLVKCLELFLTFPEVLKIFQSKFHYIHVDEFQDTNHIQYVLVRLLALGHGNIFAVGDEDQSIYGWRGADIGNIFDFKKDFPNVKILTLTQNYRSTQSIVNASNALIKNNKTRIGKVLDTKNDAGSGVQIYSAYNDSEEADYVAYQIVSLIRRGYSYKDFAVLVRANALTRKFEEKFRDYNIPHKVFGGQKFYDRMEVKNLLAYFRCVVNPRDNEAVLRIINFPVRGIGERLQEALLALAVNNNWTLVDVILSIDNIEGLTTVQRNRLSAFRDIYCAIVNKVNTLSLGDYAKYVLEQTGIRQAYMNSDKEEDKSRLENVEELVAGIYEYAAQNPSASLADYMQSVSLSTDSDNIAEEDNAIIATIHAVKGLEFRCVFVVALEDGVFPTSGSVYDDKQLEEERRVMYVAITRAVEMLFLTNAKSRFRYNKVENNPDSRFLVEIKNEIAGGLSISKSVNNTRQSVSERSQQQNYQGNTSKNDYQMPVTTKTPQFISSSAKNRAKVDISRFKPGVEVVHPKFGEGTVESVDGEVCKIYFEGLGYKMLNLTMAPLVIKE